MKLNKSRFENSQEYKSNIAEAVDKAKGMEWQLWYKGYPVGSEELWNFLNELGDAMPDIRFLPSHKASWDYGYNRFAAVMDGQPFVLGYVMYGDFSVNKDKGNKYTIRSTRINNEKYSPSRDQHNMVMPGDIKGAVKQAKKYIRPHSTLELATLMYRSIYENAGNYKAGLYE